ncbi:NAC transcription factor 29-like [Cornus florida]|uniref:NAC transcription factor 29-like n=1 Tax=Cornus florida TaxID=4283 RepID=UPI00289BBD6B|nr:NAC transcription factor 29-like [Cornus florida]
MDRGKRKLNSPHSDSVKLFHVDHARSGNWRSFIPIGVRFNPEEWELFLYLRLKVEGDPIPPETIRELDIYQYSPYQLRALYGDGDENKMFFLTPIHKLGTRTQREACQYGTWRKMGNISFTDGSATIGCKGAFSFEWKANAGQGKFLMKEYLIEGVSEWALCEVHPVEQSNKQNTDLVFDNWFGEKTSLKLRDDLEFSLPFLLLK